MVVLLVLFLLFITPVYGQTTYDYSSIDAHAKAAPDSAASSLITLSNYLTKDLRTDREKARALFRWITENITYDVSLFGKPPDPQQALKQRRAVCAGYASLFKALAETSGLTAVIIHGEAKGLGPKQAITSDGLLIHDWNAVKLDGVWYLLDCTWGAGRLDERFRFVPKFNEHYFLTPPEMLIYDHFPKEARWQLLPSPITRADFLKRVSVKSAFFENDLRLISHPYARITCDGRLTVEIGAPPETIVVGSVIRNGRDLTARAFSQRERDGFSITASFPSKGSYLLRIFARKRDSQIEEYDLAAEYQIEAWASDQHVFPKMFLSFQERNCHLDRPLSGVLQAGSEQFTLCAPGAEEVVVQVNQAVYHLIAEGDYFSGVVNLEPGAVMVFARFPGNRKHEALLRYDVK